MKKIYMTASLIGALVTGAFAQQRHCDIELVYATPPDFYVINCTDSFTLSYIFINNGPDTVFTTDILRVIDGEAPTNGSWSFTAPRNAGVGDTVISYSKKSHKNMTNTLGVEGNDEWVHAPFANGSYLYPIFFNHYNSVFIDDNPNNDVIFVRLDITCTTGIDELTGGLPKSTLNIYPNPADAASEIRMKYTFANENATVRITDVTGRLLLTRDYGKQSTGEKELSLDISSLQTGMYYIELITDNRRAINKLTVHK